MSEDKVDKPLGTAELLQRVDDAGYEYETSESFEGTEVVLTIRLRASVYANAIAEAHREAVPQVERERTASGGQLSPASGPNADLYPNRVAPNGEDSGQFPGKEATCSNCGEHIIFGAGPLCDEIDKLRERERKLEEALRWLMLHRVDRMELTNERRDEIDALLSKAEPQGQKLCDQCGEKPAICIGCYEDASTETYACGACCAHGNEDGYCRMLAEPQGEPEKAPKLIEDHEYAEAHGISGICGMRIGSAARREFCDKPREAHAKPVVLPPCMDNQLPDGPVCPKCGDPRAPSGADGGSWVHFPRKPHHRPWRAVHQSQPKGEQR